MTEAGLESHPAGFLTSPGLAAIPNVAHGFTTRALGSAGHDGSGPDPVTRALAGSAVAWRRREAVQVHGGITWTLRGEAVDAPARRADALVSGDPGDLLVVRTADCVPILAAAVGASGRALAVAAIHAGWRGLVAGILGSAVARLREAAPTGQRLVAALGPAIGPCCYEVGADVSSPLADLFGSETIRRGHGGRWFADLPGAARRGLAGLGVTVTSSPPCTSCDRQRFHSYRAEGARAGRLAAFVGLRPTSCDVP